MDMPNILEKICELLMEEDIDIPVHKVAETCWRDTGLESLALMSLVLRLEEYCHCTITNAVLRDVETFGDLAIQLQTSTENTNL